jgi:ubiquinone/menaquinone biosynthesis C-methylase UbiE
MPIDLDKREIQKQWDGDPCGAATVLSEPPESIGFYRAIRDFRYRVHGPWFDSIVRFDESRNQDILEIGVGLGSDHLRFAKNGNRMTALDLSREHLRHTQRHLALEGFSTKAVYGDAEQLGFDDETFDEVYAFGVLHHTPSIESALSEIHRVLRPGGKAVIALYNRHSWFFWVQTMLAEGLLKGGLWTKGIRKLMSEIEHRQDSSSANPLVRVYSRKDVRTLFQRFGRLEISTCHVEAGHFWRLGIFLKGPTRQQVERWFGWGGWYLVARAVKE